MVAGAMAKPSFDYDEYARKCAPDDFWGQVRRTVRGKVVDEHQIRLITDAIRQHLNLNTRDVLLDLACGNGALTRLLFDECAGCLGVDISEYLISVAKKNFEVLPEFAFLHQDAGAYVIAENEPERFTKVVCYGAFQCLPPDVAHNVLSCIYGRFSAVERVFIGNLPDRSRADAFFIDTPPQEGLLDDYSSVLGVWRTREDFEKIARATGWAVEFYNMPSDFYAAHYRYDAVLLRER